jgi:hypothetical protein
METYMQGVLLMSITDRVEQKELYHDVSPLSPYPEDQCYAEIATHVANFKNKKLVGVVKKSWQLVQMADLVNEFEEQLNKVECAWGIRDNESLGGAYVARDYIVHLPHTGEVGQSVRMLLRLSTGYNGSFSTRVGIGTLDLTCSNGMVTYKEITGATKKHTKSADLSFFASVIEQSVRVFGEKLQEIVEWKDTRVHAPEVMRVIDALDISDKLKSELYCQFRIEQAARGMNVFALVSAYTAYASGNGTFEKERPAHVLHQRQATVSKWVASKHFKQMENGRSVDGAKTQDIEWYQRLVEEHKNSKT